MTDERRPNETDQSTNRTSGEPNDEDRNSMVQVDDNDSESNSRFDSESVIRFLKWGGLLTLGILAVVAVIGLYTSLGAIIDIWIARQYRPIARTGLNFGVLAAAIAGIVAIIRRM